MTKKKGRREDADLFRPRYKPPGTDMPWRKRHILKETGGDCFPVSVSNRYPINDRRMTEIVRNLLSRLGSMIPVDNWSLELSGDVEVKDSCRGMTYSGFNRTMLLMEVTRHKCEYDSFEPFQLVHWRQEFNAIEILGLAVKDYRT